MHSFELDIFKLRLSCEHDASNGVSQKALQQNFEHTLNHCELDLIETQKDDCVLQDLIRDQVLLNSYKLHTCFVLVGMRKPYPEKE